jgi:mRNA-degrading endonuclease RelE of RelBE toxin-antitoxin system
VGEPRLTRRARRELESLPDALREAVLATLVAIGADPRGSGKPLVGELRGLWSAKVGAYRVVYSVEGSAAAPRAVVRAIGHRAAVYRRRGG